jgi:hypothetical protein
MLARFHVVTSLEAPPSDIKFVLEDYGLEDGVRESRLLWELKTREPWRSHFG